MFATTHPHPAPAGLHRERAPVQYHLRDIEGRDATLFKSFLRLLDHRLHEHWVEAVDRLHAQVLVVAGGLTSNDRQFEGPIIAVKFPIHANELERQLHSAATVLAASGRAAAHAAHAGEPHPLDMQVRIRSWPGPEILTQTWRVRLATMMTGKAWRAGDLARTASVPVEQVLSFFDELRRADLVLESSFQPLAAGHVAQTAPAPGGGLLGMIRKRLGMALVGGTR